MPRRCARTWRWAWPRGPGWPDRGRRGALTTRGAAGGGAVGRAGGVWRTGGRQMVLMQNADLGTSLNALVSLSLMYRLPALLLVTWRGHGGQDAPEHLLLGETP